MQREVHPRQWLDCLGVVPSPGMSALRKQNHPATARPCSLARALRSLAASGYGSWPDDAMFYPVESNLGTRPGGQLHDIAQCGTLDTGTAGSHAGIEAGGTDYEYRLNSVGGRGGRSGAWRERETACHGEFKKKRIEMDQM